MESDGREPRRMQAGPGQTVRGEKSPAGSVKRARERAAAGLARDNPIPPSIHSNSGTQPPQSKSSGFPKAGPWSSRTKGASSDSVESALSNGYAPQRPPRPNNTNPLLQGNAVGDSSPQINPRRARNYCEDGSSGEREFSSASRPSTTATGSSTASIPDFPTIPSMPPMPLTPTGTGMPPAPPVPQMPIPTYQPQRRNLGPPPSARRGASSYYSQTSVVHPIVEELPDTHSSYTSDHVIPTSWSDGPLEYYTSAGIDEEDEGASTPGGDSGRESRAGDHTEESNLVKKGSPERHFQPYMETLESGDESDRSGDRRTREMDWQTRQDKRWRNSNGSETDPIGRHNFWNNGRSHQPYVYSGYESDAAFLESPRSGSPNGFLRNFQPSNKINPYHGSPSSAGSPVDPRVGAILGNLEKGGALATSRTASPHPSTVPSTTDRASKRPPRLNLGSSNQGVGRGSATSLPDLIRRATKLASNLDRGRTASRVGMLDILNANEKEKREKGGKMSRTDSISDILASFPTPSPTISTYQKNSTFSPTPRGKSNLSRTHTVTHGSTRSGKPPRRRCCGMPMWAFALLIIILLLLLAAAIVIPVTLVVLPRQSESSNNPTVSSCSKSDNCKHSGTSIVVNKQCRCVCSQGWTGATCTTTPPTDNSCTNTDLIGIGNTKYNSATLGSSIPRLLTAAEPNYSIPLDGSTVASVFNANSLSCSSQNSLVTFNQKSQRRSLDPDRQAPIPLDFFGVFLKGERIPPSRASGGLHPSRVLEARSAPAAQTSNDIIFADPGSNGGANPQPSLSASTGSPASPASPSASADSGSAITQSVVDFARVSVLFVLQEAGYDIASQTLDRLQTLLGSGTTFDETQPAVAGNVTVDLDSLTVSFGNGTLYGRQG